MATYPYVPDVAGVFRDVMSTLNGVDVKFNPEKINEVGLLIQAEQKKLQSAIDSISEKSEALKTSWEGIASSAYISNISEIETAVNQLSVNLSELGSELISVSGIYTSGESQATQATEGLPTDGIFG